MKVKAYVGSPIKAASMQRIVDALTIHRLVGIEIVDRPGDADIVVHTVVGVQNFDTKPINELIAHERANGQRHAIIQCCYASTERPTPDFWGPLWADAEAVWSYLPLPIEKSVEGWLHMPLGADKAAFNIGHARQAGRDITVLTTGHVAESEGIPEVSEAVRRIGGWHMHVGPDFHLGDHVTTVSDISDAQLARLYGRSQFVAGLRRCEGFELPAAEGLLCGATPLMFDAPHYKDWFAEWARFVPETTGEPVIQAMVDVLKTPSTAAEPRYLSLAMQTFDWQRVVRTFWVQATKFAMGDGPENIRAMSVSEEA